MKKSSVLTFFTLSLLCMSPVVSMAQETNAMTGNSVASQGPEDDAIITRSINEKIKTSKVLSKLPVNVTTSQGVVTITGTVNSSGQVKMLTELAESIVGVTKVDTSNIVVNKSSQYTKDMAITAKIRALLIKEKVFGDKDVAAINLNIETTNGVVYLSGDVDNNAQIMNAIHLIKHNVSGVKSVEYRVRKTNRVHH